MSADTPTVAQLREHLGARGANAKCPAHDDTHASLSISEGRNGTPLLKCHAGCSQESVIAALRDRGIWPQPGGLTVADLARAKGLPEALLRENGFTDDEASGRPVIRMTYRGAGGETICTRYRGTLAANGSDRRFWFKRGDKQQLFGLWRLRPEPVIVVEGETDCAALWAAGFNAIGAPGSESWNEGRFAPALERCPAVLVHIEPDTGGETFRAKLLRSRLRPRMRFFTTAPAAKDPCELRAKDPNGFRAAMEQLLEHAEAAPAPEPVQESAPDPWPEPVNMLSELSAPEFRPEDMPAALSEFPAAYAQASGVDPSLALSAALASAAAALSDQIQIVADSKTEWFQQARLWVAAIGRPGAAKTPTQREMLKPLWRIHQSLDKQYHEFVAANPEEKPPRPRVIIADTTIEALSEALRDNPRGLLIANDEFESWLGSLDTYRRGGASRDRGEWLRIFDGGPHTIERVQRGSVYVENWGASILTATTPATLAKLSRQLPEDGLLQRFIPVWVRSVGDSSNVPELEALRNRYTETITQLYNAIPRAHKGCVPMSFQAQEFFTEWVKRSRITAEGFGSIETALESHLAKYPTFLLRVLLVFHAANVVNQDHESARDPAAFQVSLSTAQVAAAFLKRASRHAIATYLNRDGSEAYQLARDVARAILARAWKTVARRELVQGVPAFRKATQELQDAVLRLLVDLGWLRHLEGGYQKPLPARFMVNPAVEAKFAAIAAQERERRAAVRGAMAESIKERRGESQ